MAWHIIISYWTTLPVVYWRIMVGPVNSHVFWFWCCIMDGQWIRMTLTGISNWIIKLLTIVVRKAMLPIVDDFMAMFFLSVNITVTTFLGYVSICTRYNHLSETRFIGWPMDWAKYTPMDFK